MIIMKFGGSSLATGERVREVASIIQAHLAEKPIIVLSAMGKTTDHLIEAGKQALAGNIDGKAVAELHRNAAHDLGLHIPEVDGLLHELEELLVGIRMIKELSPKTMDYLVSFGERLSVRIMASYCNSIGMKSRFFDAWDVGIQTDNHFMDAEVLPATYATIASSLYEVTTSYPYTPFITGFLGKDKEGNITTLGRGGSDLTAAIVGAALQVKEIQVWKNVDGLLSADPRLCPKAIPVPLLSLEEASELAYFGAKILHPRSIIPAMQKNIPVRVKNSYNPNHPGTVIQNNALPPALVRAMTMKQNITLVDITSTRMLGQHGFLAKVFDLFGVYEVSVDMVATSEVSISLTIDSNEENLDRLVPKLQEFAVVHINHQKSIISLIGNIQKSSEILATAFATMTEKHINVEMMSQGASKVNISFIVDDAQAEPALKALHHAFFEVKA
ncbi:aspartate kinase [Candidatus Woesearchaeota archaeon]|nr:aspartate kinase [Candidatus Woesearchaeota archaeon]